MSHTRIKFCGLTRPEDVHQAIELGVDFIGLVFAPRSPRRLTLDAAIALRRRVPEEIAVVALTMDNPAEEVAAIATRLRPDLLQFHGSETDAYCQQFGLPYWKAIAMQDEPDVPARLAAYPGANGFLFDGHAAGESGGSGQRFDWSRMPRSPDKPFLLAGGLGPHNVGTALRVARPWGVDVSSGIETAPGIKDAEKMRGFVGAVRRAEHPG